MGVMSTEVGIWLSGGFLSTLLTLEILTPDIVLHLSVLDITNFDLDLKPHHASDHGSEGVSRVAQLEVVHKDHVCALVDLFVRVGL